jgi:hypothetical protein
MAQQLLGLAPRRHSRIGLNAQHLVHCGCQEFVRPPQNTSRLGANSCCQLGLENQLLRKPLWVHDIQTQHLIYHASAAAADELLCQPRKSNEHIGLFFCEHDCVDSLNCRTILGSLIRQCLSVDALPKDIESQLKEMFEGTSPDAEDLEAVLHTVADTSEKLTFIIDGIDECPEQERTMLLRILSRSRSFNSPIKLFISSREGFINEIRVISETLHRLTMHCKEAEADVPAYVEGIIQEKIKDGKLMVGSKQLGEEIQDALIQGANGM